MDEQAGGAAEASMEESEDKLIEELTASPSPIGDYLMEDLEDDPQLMQENIKKFQMNIREFTRFSVVSLLASTFLFA